jgi:hypothetical protein
MQRIVVWGLKSDFHSHKFIQRSFYSNARQLGFDSIWVDDSESNASLIKRGDIVFAVDVASKALPIVKGAKYVLHNIDPTEIGLDSDFVKIQVHTNLSRGENLGQPYVHWDSSSRTLFQPWGIPKPPRSWLMPQKRDLNTEYWVGSVWNNELNQGNAEFMRGYIGNLRDLGINFVQIGKLTRFHPNGVSESKAQRLVSKSAIGAAVVGNWQKINNYIPCRLFKNIAAGVPASSNADFSELFNDGIGIFDPSPVSLISKIIQLPLQERIELVREAQSKIVPYSYQAGINRILSCLTFR